jgi:CBS domain-containing membrane protein
VHDQVLATGLAVSVAIAVMSLTRCLHPPGGAAALTAALGGPAVAATGFAFPLFPVGVNSLLLVAMGIGFHRLARRNYPHVAIPPAATHGTLDPPAQIRAGIRPEDIDAALSALDETYDISRDDIDRLLQEVEVQALMRKSDGLRCGDIMSKDVVKAEEAMPIEEARQLLLDHNIRILPVLDGDGRLTGTVGLRELAGATGTVADVRSHAATATSDHPAILLAPMLTDGRAHAVVIVDAECHVVGLITQTDLLAAVIRLRTSQTFPKD